MSVTDSFTDTNGTNLTAHGGGNWGKATTGEQQIQSNTLVPNNASDQLCYWNANTFNNDQTAKATAALMNDTSDHVTAPCVRAATAALTCYTLYYNQNSGHKLEVIKIVGGTATQLGADGSAVAATHTVKISATGTSIQGFIDDVSNLGPFTDSSIASGRAGTYGFGSSTTTSMDDWIATGEIAAGGGDGLTHGQLTAMTGITF